MKRGYYRNVLYPEGIAKRQDASIKRMSWAQTWPDSSLGSSLGTRTVCIERVAVPGTRLEQEEKMKSEEAAKERGAQQLNAQANSPLDSRFSLAPIRAWKNHTGGLYVSETYPRVLYGRHC